MAVTTFIPEVWNARLLRALETRHVYGQPAVINRNYQGDITQAGDTVHIGTIGEVTVKSFTRNTDIDAPETLATTDQTLLIDQEKYYNFQVDDVDAAQAAGDLIGPAQVSAAYQLSSVADQYLAGLPYAAVEALGDPTPYQDGDDTTPTAVVAAAEAYDALVGLSVILDENDVPEEGRFAIIPPWFAGLLAKDTRLIDNVPGLIANGIVGQVDRLTVYRSNNVPNTTGTKYKVIAGYPGAWTFAEQVVKTVAYSPERRFGDAVKGLHVYGAKVIRPTAFAIGTYNKA